MVRKPGVVLAALAMAMRVPLCAFAIAFCTTPAVAQASVGPASPTGQLAGPQGCRFTPPADWQGGGISWHGACHNGMAHGNGVLRAHRKGQAPLLFLGDLDHGELHSGVIEGRDGYVAGRFAEGEPVPQPERNDLIRAFRSASAAARAFSVRLKHAGNAGSAAFYRKKAQELARQMD